MDAPMEDQLRDLLASVAAEAPAATGLAEGARRKVRHRRRVRTALATGGTGLAAAGIAVGLVVGGSQGQPTASPPAGSSAGPGGGAASTADGTGRPDVGALRSTGESCVEEYSPAAVAERSFAFDGTVTAIGPAASNRPGAEIPLVGVTFRVQEWFRGGTGTTVTVDMDPPAELGRSSDPGGPAYAVGTRLLVSGEPRWGGAPLDDAIAGVCGFTRYYDATTAAAWAAATR